MTRTFALSLVAGSLVAFSLVTLGAPVRAEAQTVGLAPFEGPRNRQVRRVVRDALEERVTVVDVEPDDTGDVDAVVTGTLAGRRARPRLTLTLSDPDGQERASQTLRVTSGRRAQRLVARAVRALLDEAGELSSQDEPEPEPAEREPEPEPEEPEEEAPSEPFVPETRASNRRPFLHLLVGLNLRNRDLSVELAGSRLVHTVPFYPELSAEARVRPLAGSGDPLLAGIRARIRFGYALFFESETPSAQVIAGSSWSLEGDAGWLAPLDDQGWVELGAVVGGGFTSHGLDDNALINTVEYGTFEARAVTRIRAMDEVLVIRAEAGYRLRIGSGRLADDHGSIVGHGVVVEGGLEGMYPIDDTIAVSWLAAIEWQDAGLGFSDPAGMELANGGSERFVRGRLAIGLAFR